ncbi:MAG: hypothetical protein IPK88_12110 [Saprospiraceae bacterium]|nr:hypothetical protein [Candidatus Defluviibacterium haderslevense]
MKGLNISLIILLIIDLVFSFYQYYYIPLDGDMAAIIVPSPQFQKMMQDPFGMHALNNHEMYMGSNRFFAHWTMKLYFETIPILLQHFTDPITSIYLSCAFAKIITHLLLVILVWFYCLEKPIIKSLHFILFTLIISSFFQTYGFHNTMGIIDTSITYQFFYAWPMCLLMVFYLPFIIRFYHNKHFQFSPIQQIFSYLLALIMAFNGPLLPAIVTIISFIIATSLICSCLKKHEGITFINYIKQQISLIPKPFIFLYFFTLITSIYSLYIGTFNVENLNTKASILERYQKLPFGLFKILSENLGWSLIIVFTCTNIYLARKINALSTYKMNRTIKYIGLFILLYIALLPLGGFREYRPFILRYDTLIPVTLIILMLNGTLIINNLHHINQQYKKYYIGFLVFIVAAFNISDSKIPKNNLCEKNALLNISNSNNDTLRLTNDCTVMSWNKIKKSEALHLNSIFLKNVNVIQKNVIFYHYE